MIYHDGTFTFVRSILEEPVTTNDRLPCFEDLFFPFPDYGAIGTMAMRNGSFMHARWPRGRRVFHLPPDDPPAGGGCSLVDFFSLTRPARINVAQVSRMSAISSGLSDE